jgi:hypothetical protein
MPKNKERSLDSDEDDYRPPSGEDDDSKEEESEITDDSSDDSSVVQEDEEEEELEKRSLLNPKDETAWFKALEKKKEEIRTAIRSNIGKYLLPINSFFFKYLVLILKNL